MITRHSLMVAAIWLVTNPMVAMMPTNRIMETGPQKVELPAPALNSSTSIEEALQERRSIRQYRNAPLTLKEISQLLWAAQGITEEHTGFRTAPSAGALYPLEVYMVINQGDELPVGVWHYLPEEHHIEQIKDENIRKACKRQP